MLITINAQDPEQMAVLEDLILTLAKRLVAEGSLGQDELTGKSLDVIAHLIHPSIYLYQMSELDVAYMRSKGIEGEDYPFPAEFIQLAAGY